MLHTHLPMYTEECAPNLVPPLDLLHIQTVAALFALLADPSRLAILSLLAQSPGEVCVCDITARVPVAQSTISHHLKVLKEAGLVASDKRGKWVYYALVRQSVAEIESVLSATLGSVAIP